MDLSQAGSTFRAIRRLRGTSKIEGKATGRQLDFRFTASASATAGSTSRPMENRSAGRRTPTALRVGSAGTAGRAVVHAAHAPRRRQNRRRLDPNLITYAIRRRRATRPAHPQMAHGPDPSRLQYERTRATSERSLRPGPISPRISSSWASMARPRRHSATTRVSITPTSTTSERAPTEDFPAPTAKAPRWSARRCTTSRKLSDRPLPGRRAFSGGFLTYSLLMNFPEAMAGAFRSPPA